MIKRIPHRLILPLTNACPNFAKQFTYPESVDDWIMEAIRKNFVRVIVQVFTFSYIDFAMFRTF